MEMYRQIVTHEKNQGFQDLVEEPSIREAETLEVDDLPNSQRPLLGYSDRTTASEG